MHSICSKPLVLLALSGLEALLSAEPEAWMLRMRVSRPFLEQIRSEPAFPGLPWIAGRAEEMTWESVGISYCRLLTPCHTQDCEDLQGALSATRGLAPGVLGTRQECSCRKEFPLRSSQESSAIKRAEHAFGEYPLTQKYYLRKIMLK